MMPAFQSKIKTDYDESFFTTVLIDFIDKKFDFLIAEKLAK